MADVTISRGVQARDDYPDASIAQVNSGTVSGVTAISDGDLITWNGTFTNPANNDFALIYRVVSPGIPTTFVSTASLARFNVVTLQGTNLQVFAYIHFDDSTQYTWGSTSTTTGGFKITPLGFPTPNKTIDRIGFIVSSSGATGIFNFSVIADFIQVFKELLTLPAVNQPFDISTPRLLVELPILQREGGIIQDLGSLSSTLLPTGVLSTTTTPNNYTGLQWTQVLQGLELETGGNLAPQVGGSPASPIWQWFTSEQLSCKVAINSFRYRPVPGRRDYYEFFLLLRKIDILSATAQTWGAIQ